MAIRLPLTTVLDYTVTSTDRGSGSVSGGIAKPFLIPQDTDNIVVKFYPSLVGATVSATLQTSDDGGTTWYDVVRTPTLATSQNAPLWASAPVCGVGVRSPVLPISSTTTGVSQTSILQTTGSASASTLGAGQVSGLPILGVANRIFLIYTGDITAASFNYTQVKVLVNSQSATA
jgi:hypothetical protein